VLGDNTQKENWSGITLRGAVYGPRKNSNKCYCNATNTENFKEQRLMDASKCTSCNL